MHWFRRFRRQDVPIEDLLDFNVDAYVSRALKGEITPGVAIARLREERRYVERRLKSLEKSRSRMTSQRMRGIGNTGPRMGPEIMRAEMQLQHDASVDAGKSSAEVTLESHLGAIREGISWLQSSVSSPRIDDM